MTKLFRKYLGNQDFSEIITKGFSFFLIRVLGALIGYVFTIYISKNYGADVYGLIALGFSMFLIISVIGLLGLDINIVKYFSQDRNDSNPGIFYKSLIVSFIISVFSVWIINHFREFIVIHVYKQPKPELVDYLPWILWAIPFWNVALICSSFFRAKKLNIAYTYINYPSRFLLTLILLFFLSSVNQNPILIVKLHFWSIVITATLSLIFVISKLKLSLKSKDKHTAFVKDSFPMLVSSSVLILLTMIDTQIMGIYETKANVGIYNVAIKIAALTAISIQAVNSILAPKIANSYVEDKTRFEKLVKFSANLNFTITFIILIIIISFHNFLLNLFGEVFLEGRNILFILCVGQLVNSFSGSVGVILQMIGKQKVYRNFVLTALFINLVLNFILTPKYGGVGAASATVISLIFWNIGCSIYIKRNVGISSYFTFYK